MNILIKWTFSCNYIQQLFQLHIIIIRLEYLYLCIAHRLDKNLNENRWFAASTLTNDKNKTWFHTIASFPLANQHEWYHVDFGKKDDGTIIHYMVLMRTCISNTFFPLQWKRERERGTLGWYARKCESQSQYIIVRLSLDPMEKRVSVKDLHSPINNSVYMCMIVRFHQARQCRHKFNDNTIQRHNFRSVLFSLLCFLCLRRTGRLRTL